MRYNRSIVEPSASGLTELLRTMASHPWSWRATLTSVVEVGLFVGVAVFVLLVQRWISTSALEVIFWLSVLALVLLALALCRYGDTRTAVLAFVLAAVAALLVVQSRS